MDWLCVFIKIDADFKTIIITTNCHEIQKWINNYYKFKGAILTFIFQKGDQCLSIKYYP